MHKVSPTLIWSHLEIDLCICVLNKRGERRVTGKKNYWDNEKLS